MVVSCLRGMLLLWTACGRRGRCQSGERTLACLTLYPEGAFAALRVLMRDRLVLAEVHRVGEARGRDAAFVERPD